MSDVAPIAPPPGWTAERSGGTLLFQSEDTVFWTFTALPGGPPPGDAVGSAFSALREEYGDVDESPAEGPPLVPGEVARDAGFFALDDTAAARARGFRVGGVTYLIYYQGADRDVEARREELEQLGRRAWLGIAAAASAPDPTGPAAAGGPGGAGSGGGEFTGPEGFPTGVPR